MIEFLKYYWRLIVCMTVLGGTLGLLQMNGSISQVKALLVAALGGIIFGALHGFLFGNRPDQEKEK